MVVEHSTSYLVIILQVYKSLILNNIKFFFVFFTNVVNPMVVEKQFNLNNLYGGCSIFLEYNHNKNLISIDQFIMHI